MATAPETTDCRILVVDDEQANIDLLAALLDDDGFRNVVSTRDPRMVLELYESFQPDLVLLDLHMPHMTGFAVMDRLAERRADDDFIPILVLTADANPEARLRALGQGASDFLTKPLDAMEVTLRIRNLLTTRVLHRQQQAARERAEAQKRRAELLSEASRALGASLDVQTTLAMLPRLAVPRLADYSVLELDDEDGGRRVVGAAHVDRAAETLLGADAPRAGGAGADPTGAGAPLWGGALPLGHAGVTELAAGTSLLLSAIEPVELADGATDVERAALDRLGPTSLIIVPLVVAGRVAGRLTLAMSVSGRRFDDDDLELATELMRRASAAQDNARLYDEAQRATRARDRILAVVAHDLRNPLNTIRMAADLLLEDDASPHRRQFEIVHRTTDRMNELIQNLLEVSRIEGGNLSLVREPVDIRMLVAEAAAMLGPLAAAREIALETAIDDALPVLMADATRLLQVISNLVGNAVKFTDRGGRIRILCTAAPGEVRFAVADTGRGIPPDQLAHVFGTFWQASPGDRRGIGLGLSIARGIVEGHGGRIHVDSEVGRGTTFHFTIPLGDAGPTAAAPATAAMEA